MIESANTIAAFFLVLNSSVTSPQTSIQIVRATQDPGVLDPASARSAGSSPFKPAGTAMTTRSVTEIQPLPEPARPQPAIDRVYERISSFKAPGVEDALAFLSTLPSYYPLPRSVCTEDEVVGLFWKSGNFYADIEFPGGGLMSVFTRQRGEHNGEHNLDKGLDNIPVSLPFDRWGPNYLKALLPSTRAAA